MIKYATGNLGIFYIIRLRGSVFPKAFILSLPNAALAFLLHLYCRQEETSDGILSMNGVQTLWAGYSSVLGFLIVFRNNQAYTRFWEGATLINQIRGEWFNAVSSLVAFCNSAPDYTERVDDFKGTLICLASMLYCSALQQVCELTDNTLEIIDNHNLDPDSLQFMQGCNDRCEIILQWMQRLIVESDETETVKVSPPLLTRAFQELSRGIVNLNNARKIKDTPFPFPYAQMITAMMIVHWVTTPVIASQMIESQVLAPLACFCVTFAFWCLLYIAQEIDQPFGDDANDLPLREMMQDFNTSLLNLMHPLAQRVPSRRGGRREEPSRRDSAHLLPSTSGDTANVRTSSCTRDSIRSWEEDVVPPEDPIEMPFHISSSSKEVTSSIAAGGDGAAASYGSAGAAAGVPCTLEAVGSSKSEVPLEQPIKPVTGKVTDDPDSLLVAHSRRSISAPVLPGDVHEARNGQTGGAPYSPRASPRSSMSTDSESDLSDIHT